MLASIAIVLELKLIALVYWYCTVLAFIVKVYLCFKLYLKLTWYYNSSLLFELELTFVNLENMLVHFTLSGCVLRKYFTYQVKLKFTFGLK